MKVLALGVVALVALGLLLVTNPRMEDYEQYLRQEILVESGKGDDVGKAIGVLVSGVASSLMTSATVRHDYVFWSAYETTLGNDRLKVLGILRNFAVLRGRVGPSGTAAPGR
jgi:hypothetical protein